MFIGSNAIAFALKTIAIGLTVTVYAVAAHLIWVARLARAPVLARRSRPSRILLVAAATVTPVISFWIVETGEIRRHASSRNSKAGIANLLGLGGLTLAIPLIGTAFVEWQRLQEGIGWAGAFDRFFPLLAFLVVLQAILFMIGRVMGMTNRIALGWITLFAAIAIIALLML